MTPKESMEYTLSILRAVETVAKESEMTVEQCLFFTIKVLEAHIKGPQLELVKNDDFL